MVSYMTYNFKGKGLVAVLYFKDQTMLSTTFFGFFLKYLSFCLQLLFDSWGQCQCRRRWLIRAKPLIDFTHLCMSNACVFNRILTLLLFMMTCQSMLSLLFLNARLHAAQTYRQHTPSAKFQSRGGVFRGGMWDSLDQVNWEHRGKKNNVQAFQQRDNRAHYVWWRIKKLPKHPSLIYEGYKRKMFWNWFEIHVVFLLLNLEHRNQWNHIFLCSLFMQALSAHYIILCHSSLNWTIHHNVYLKVFWTMLLLLSTFVFCKSGIMLV